MESNRSKTFLKKIAEVFKPTLFVGFGIVLPTIALLVELTTQMCADTVHYDPIPTWPHIVIVALVPIVLLVWGIMRHRGLPTHSPIWRVALGLVAGISLSYAIPFAPIVPIALIMVFFGIGFLPLAPFGTFAVAAYSMFRTNREAGSVGWWGTLGFAVGLLLVAALAYPEFSVERKVEAALQTDSDSATKSAAIAELRSVDPKKVETFLCDYKRPQWPNPARFVTMELIDFRSYSEFHPELYWRVTGEPCPSNMWSRDVRFVPGRDNEPGLAIASSRYDASVSANAGIVYTEWLYEVKNSDTRIREADFVVQLPPGGVVSRVTLWVHNEPKEATFAGRAKAQGAYEAVVSRSRDPILVTEESPGRIRVRMFPVNPGDVMKARIGVTHPMIISEDSLETILPTVVGGNVAHDIEHDVWIESKGPLTSSDNTLRAIARRDDYQLRGTIEDQNLSTAVIRSGFPTEAVFAPFDDQVVEQTFQRSEIPAPEHLILAIDGSVEMLPYRDALTNAVKKLPKSVAMSLYFSTDGDPLIRYERLPLTDENRARIIDAIGTFDFAGGRDNVPILREAQRRAVEENARIVWVHASQEVAFGGLLMVEGRDAVRIDTLQVDGNRDVLSDSIHAGGNLRAIPRTGSVADDLARFFSRIGGSHYTFTRSLRPTARIDSVETSKHLVRLWSYDRVTDILQNGTREEAIEFAARAQIVTAASAALVLETEAQYKQFGLDQATGGGVPTIPEPEEWALIIVATLALCVVAWRRRREEEMWGVAP